MTDKQSFGRALRMERQAIGWTQVRLADALGVTKQAVCQWESGVDSPTFENLIALDRSLRLTPGTLWIRAALLKSEG